MIYPNKKVEIKLFQQGYQLIAGLDEAGRGAWAGPIVAGAIVLPQKPKIKNKKIKIKDSKLLTVQQRQLAYDWLIENCLGWSVGVVSQKIIDQVGITKANILAFRKALAKLKLQPDFLLIDSVKFSYKKIPSQSIIDGDYKVLSIAAASIIAKHSRDEMLKKYHKKYPQYGFDRHKGYGTSKHYEMICQHGICCLHRQSYRPIKNFV